jgi:hypothetical protein
MKVDPQAQNYVTVKLWGSDKGAASGRLVLFANGLQVGYRHEGDYDVLNQCDNEALAPGRFVYVTLPLPPQLTHGKTSVDLKILGLGAMWPYGPTFDTYQKALTQPTRGIYRAYTHVDPCYVPDASEEQGETPAAQPRTSPGEEVISECRDTVKKRLTNLLRKTTPADERSRLSEMELLAFAYNTAWTPAYHDSRAIDQILRDGDAVAKEFAQQPKMFASNWVGAGPLGKAVILVWPAIGKRMSEPMEEGSTIRTRGKAWAPMLRASVDYWRMNRRSYTNQSMIVDANIYTANHALELIDPGMALPAEKVLHYLYQATGIEPWLGSDTADGGSEAPFGTHYYLVTRKSLSRELGFVATYGETILHFLHDMVLLTGDEKLREQMRKIQEARLYFRYPALDADGFRCMKLVSEIDNRTAHYPLDGSAYLEPNIREAWWMETAAMLSEDPAVVGAAQQSIADGQYFTYIAGRLKDSDTEGMMRNVDDWEKVRGLQASARVLPGTPGQADYVFTDEENAVLAMKHGDTSLFINFYYRAERAVNDVARIFEVNPTLTRIATVRPEVCVIKSGEVYERPDWIDNTRSAGHVPPGEQIHQAWAGDKMTISKRPDDAKYPAYGDWGPFLGKAAFYSLHYGPYLIGMNTTEDRTYTLHPPAGLLRAKDLVSGKQVEFSSDYAVPPQTTVVFFLGDVRQETPIKSAVP